MKILMAIALAASLTILLHPSPLFAQCNAMPLGYCGKTDTNSYSAAAPTLGAAGTVTVDPDFGSKVLRVTQSGSCGSSAGGGGLTPNAGAGWQRVWNADDSKLILDGDGGWYYMNLLTSPQLTTGACVQITPTKLGNNPNFAWTVTNRIYGTGTDGKSLAYWDAPSGSPVNVFDMSTIPGFSVSFLYLLEGDTDDAWFCAANNGQDTGNQIGCYNQKTKATQVLNLGNATAQQGTSAPVPLNNLTAANTAGCGIHTLQILKGGDWMGLTLNGCAGFPKANDPGNGTGMMFWRMGTNTVTYLPSDWFYGSHSALGWNSAWVNAPGDGSQPPCPDFNISWKMFFVSNPGTAAAPDYVQLNPCYGPLARPFSLDTHQTWENNVNDSNVNAYPVITEVSNGSSPNINRYLEWEIAAIQTAPAVTAFKAGKVGTSASGTIWRLAHTYNDPVDANCPQTNYISPNVSRDGKYVAFTSDWMGATGKGNCTNNRRLDTFVVDLSTAGSSATPPVPSPPTGLHAVVQ